MSANSRGRIYDYRIREQIVQTGRVGVLTALLRLVLTVLRISGVQLGRVTVRAHRQALLYALGQSVR